MASADEFAAMFYGESGVLGLLGNGISAFLVLLQNFYGAQTGVPSQGVEHILAVGLVGGWALVVSGVLELVILMRGLYGAAALLLKGVTQRYILKGFGTPLFDVLLLGTANNSNNQKIEEEKKKNTQYAEPMALGYLCDTISPFIFAAFCFGYLPSFFVGTIWVTINAFYQLFSSYYAYLRKDVYHTTKFCLHSTYWLVKSWEEFVLSVLIDKEGAVEEVYRC
ncbi:UNVERIFIED_CONTAM: hypothetical protein FKN15_076042 [Acipenser sinensis]